MNHAILEGKTRSPGGVLRKLLLFCCGALFAFQSGAQHLAFIVLDTAKPPAGKFPDGWQLKVNSGQPDVSTGTDNNESVIHFKSAKSSFSLEHGLGIDLSRTPYLVRRCKETGLTGRGDLLHHSGDGEAGQWMGAIPAPPLPVYSW